MKKIVAFPLMGDYGIPATYLFKHIMTCKIINIPSISNKTVELGVKNSPDFVCTPFKYTLGTLIECLDNGANILIQLGGGCRYGYYANLQEKILKDLGYDFKMYNLVTAGTTHPFRIYKCLKEIDKNINILKTFYYLLITIKMVKYMDLVDVYIRENIGFEKKVGSFEKLKQKMLKEFSEVKSIFKLRKVYKKYMKLFKRIQLNKPDKIIKIGLIGELYTLMESRANYDIEKFLASHNISMTRFTNVTYLLFKKGRLSKKYLKKLDNVKYKMGADAMDNIYYTKYLCENKYDGIIHMKSSFCTPEIGAMPIIKKVASDYGIPVLFLTMDTNSSIVGLTTRLEAFIDMLEMRN